MLDDETAQLHRRLVRIMAVLGVLGAVVAVGWRGPLWALGFAAGAALAFLNVRFYVRLADALGDPDARQFGPRTGRILVRLILLGAVGFVMLKILAVPWIAVISGLFVAVAAALVVMVRELLYARA